MTPQQITTIRCAYADLLGAYQAYESLDIHSHDWEAHLSSIKEMERDFTFLDTGEEDHHNHTQTKGVILKCNCGEIIESKCNELYYTLDESKNPIRNSDGSITLSQYKNSDMLCYSDAPDEIKQEIRKIVKKQIKTN